VTFFFHPRQIDVGSQAEELNHRLYIGGKALEYLGRLY